MTKKVQYIFKNHPEWDTTENWDDDDNDLQVVASCINNKQLKFCSTDLNPRISLIDFKQSATVSENTLIVTIE